MVNLPSSADYKFAFTGTNCSGKTTMALEVTARLKAEDHALAEVVSSQDRKITWKDAHFPVDYRAHYGMICNLIHAEVQAELKGDARIVVTDRSVLDLVAIALTDHPNNPLVTDGLLSMCLDWAQSYTRIYYLEPLPYQEDGKRPANDFRMKTHETLVTKVMTIAEVKRKVVRVPRHEVMADLRSIVGLEKKNAILLEPEKWQAVANATNLKIAVKRPKWASTSDRDLFVLVANDYTGFANYSRARVEKAIDVYFGEDNNIQILEIPDVPIGHLRGLVSDIVFYSPDLPTNR